MNTERITEQALVLPALYIIKNTPGIKTSELIRRLEAVFDPGGADAEILAGRRDTKFSQKVRNLKSHRDTKGMSRLTGFAGGAYTITQSGLDLLAENAEAMDCLFGGGFRASDAVELAESAGQQTAGHKLIVYDENDMISEGRAKERVSVTKERSRKLRAAAIAHYSDADGHIKCAVCGFDFLDTYGELGRGFMEIYHEKPVYQYSDDGFDICMAKALARMKPVCSNCHSMLHRAKKEPLAVSELQKILQRGIR